MFKFAAIVSLMLIGSSMWAASLSCDSCGSECASACGTRHFRSCCFNYLRRKRAPDSVKFTPASPNLKPQELPKTEKQKLPLILVQDIPESWSPNMIPGDFAPYPYEEIYENRFFDV